MHASESGTAVNGMHTVCTVTAVYFFVGELALKHETQSNLAQGREVNVKWAAFKGSVNLSIHLFISVTSFLIVTSAGKKCLGGEKNEVCT